MSLFVNNVCTGDAHDFIKSVSNQVVGRPERVPVLPSDGAMDAFPKTSTKVDAAIGQVLLGRARSTLSNRETGGLKISLGVRTPQVNEDYAQYTNMGAAVTLICFVVCVLLFASEVVRPVLIIYVLDIQSGLFTSQQSRCFSSRLKHMSRGSQDITFPRVSCSIITLDTTEVSGERHMDIHDGHILKRRLNSEGVPIEAPKKDKINKFKDHVGNSTNSDSDSDTEEEEKEP
eukprot:9171864-Pyramimonas_sp.AAC.1